MKTIEMFFGNLFDRVNITTFRLVAFTHYLLAALVSNNDKKVNDDYIAKLSAKLKAVEDGMDQQDVSLAVQLSKTGSVNNVVDDFEHYMHEVYVDIAFHTKTNPEALQQFYPRGKSEYYNISRADAPVIMNRVSDLAGTHGVLLGKDLKDKLQSFAISYTAIRETQLEEITAVSEHRSEKNVARQPLELMLMEVLHEIARRHPGDLTTCKSYINWGLLYPASKKEEDNKPVK